MTAFSPDATTIAVEVASSSGRIVKREWWVTLRGRQLLFDMTMAGVLVLTRGGGLRYLKFILKQVCQQDGIYCWRSSRHF